MTQKCNSNCYIKHSGFFAYYYSKNTVYFHSSQIFQEALAVSFLLCQQKIPCDSTEFVEYILSVWTKNTQIRKNIYILKSSLIILFSQDSIKTLIQNSLDSSLHCKYLMLDNSKMHGFTEMPSLAKRALEIPIWVLLARILLLLKKATQSDHSKSNSY